MLMVNVIAKPKRRGCGSGCASFSGVMQGVRKVPQKVQKHSLFASFLLHICAKSDRRK